MAKDQSAPIVQTDVYEIRMRLFMYVNIMCLYTRMSVKRTVLGKSNLIVFLIHKDHSI